MVEASKIKSLAERRRLLVAESTRLREEASAELDYLALKLDWAERIYAKVLDWRPYWPVAAAAGGFFLARGRGRSLRWLGKLWSLWRLGRKLSPLWQRFV